METRKLDLVSTVSILQALEKGKPCSACRLEIRVARLNVSYSVLLAQRKVAAGCRLCIGQ
jgi:hypothetical protein